MSEYTGPQQNPHLSPRPWPSAEEISAAHERPLRREWSKFDFSECKHPLMVGVTPLGVNQGDWFVEICVECGHVESECVHRESEWNEAGTLLRCKVCGIDGT